jgi:hypothetical protein
MADLPPDRASVIYRAQVAGPNVTGLAAAKGIPLELLLVLPSEVVRALARVNLRGILEAGRVDRSRCRDHCRTDIDRLEAAPDPFLALAFCLVGSFPDPDVSHASYPPYAPYAF